MALTDRSFVKFLNNFLQRRSIWAESILIIQISNRKNFNFQHYLLSEDVSFSRRSSLRFTSRLFVLPNLSVRVLNRILTTCSVRDSNRKFGLLRKSSRICNYYFGIVLTILRSRFSFEWFSSWMPLTTETEVWCFTQLVKIMFKNDKFDFEPDQNPSTSLKPKNCYQTPF